MSTKSITKSRVEVNGHFPAELKEANQYVVWKYGEKNSSGKPKKLPHSVQTGSRCDVTDIGVCVSFEAAMRACLNGYDGIGFVFTLKDPYTGFDLDNCRDPSTGVIAGWAKQFIKLLDGYTEVSPTETGVKIWVRGKLLHGNKRLDDAGIEMYDHDRYFTVTGQHVDGTPTIIQDRADRIELAYLVAQLCRQVKGRKLWGGDWSDYQSSSEADLALAAILRGITQSREHIKAIMHYSGLCREKYERDDYLDRTIDKVLSEHTFHLTDLGNAERFVAQHGNEIRYSHAQGHWFVWDERCWIPDELGRVHQRAKQTVRSIYQEAADTDDDERRQALSKHARYCESEKGIRAMISLARREAGIVIHPNQLDQDPYKLNVLNGTVDLHSGSLLPHTREHYMTKIAPVEYDPGAKCSLWLAFLDRVMEGNQELIGYLQRAVGYALTGDVREQCLFFLYGGGGNGKTTFSETIRSMLGDYAQKAPSDLLKLKGGISNDTARLRGARLAVMSELEEGMRWDEAKVKDLADDSKLVARFLYQNSFEFMPTHKLWIYGNHRPLIRGTDDGIWRRMRLVPFTVQIPEYERDKHLKDKLMAELPGILRWAVEGCLAWQQHGLGMPSTVGDAIAEYREEMDAIGQFIKEECIVAPGEQVVAKTLYSLWCKWADDNGEYPGKSKQFYNRMRERGLRVEKGRANKTVICGVRPRFHVTDDD